MAATTVLVVAAGAVVMLPTRGEVPAVVIAETDRVPLPTASPTLLVPESLRPALPTVPSNPRVRAAEPKQPDDPVAPREEGWEQIPNPPFAPAHSLVAWTGSELLVVGGSIPNGGIHNQAAAFDPTSGAWRSTAPAPQDLWTHSATAHWTGRELLVYGHEDAARDRDPSFAYHPRADVWRPIPRAPLGEVTEASSVWTGKEMIVIATPLFNGPPVGAAYDPESDTWRRIAAFPDDQSRFAPMVVWTGTELVLWQGRTAQGWLGTQEPPPDAKGGAAYDPQTDTWRVLAVAEEATGLTAAAWTGKEIIGFTGREDGSTHVYAISADLEAVRRLADLPDGAAITHRPVWTGQEILLFGHPDPDVSGVALDPDRAAWRLLDDPGIEAERGLVVGWTGTQAVVLGGQVTVIMETERAAEGSFTYTPPLR